MRVLIYKMIKSYGLRPRLGLLIKLICNFQAQNKIQNLICKTIADMITGMW